MVKYALVPNTLLDPARVHDIPLQFVLHVGGVGAPNLHEEAVFMHHVIGAVVVANDFTTTLKNASPNRLNVLLRLAHTRERVCEDGERLAHEDILLHSVLQA
mmetsp:Transcript_7223/g.10098  ORF Transcript_7223/g.10098 Transcript_7223/m.10098 type:complete len:102 (+) Transcript_7223:554-859(+)